MMNLVASPCRYLAVCLGMASAFGAATFARAQDDSAKVLVVTRELVKPGKAAAHQRSEAAFANALIAGHSSVHFTALQSLTGPPRVLFLRAYPSFSAWEAAAKSVGPQLGATLDRLDATDGEMVTDNATSALMLRPDLSTNTKRPAVGTRVLEINQYVVRPGHVHEFEELAKLYIKGFENIPEVHWTAYELAYGGYGPIAAPVFVTFTAYKSGAEVDAANAAADKLATALGKDKMELLSTLTAASVQNETSNLFYVDPKMSNVSEEEMKTDPEFWTHKAPAAKKAQP